MSNSLHVADNILVIKKTVLLECINKGIKYTIMLYYMMTVLLEYIDCLLEFFTNA